MATEADFDRKRISERIDLLKEIADDLSTSAFAAGDVMLFSGRLALAANGYFLLNRCYKEWRMEDGHFTELPKIAALQSMAIMTFDPFQPTDPSHVTTMAAARCNEIYALAYASAILGTNILAERENFYLRLFEVLSKARSETLEPYLVDQRAQVYRPLWDYQHPIHEKDKLTANTLITIFELIANQFD